MLRVYASAGWRAKRLDMKKGVAGVTHGMRVLAWSTARRLENCVWWPSLTRGHTSEELVITPEGLAKSLPLVVRTGKEEIEGARRASLGANCIFNSATNTKAHTQTEDSAARKSSRSSARETAAGNCMAAERASSERTTRTALAEWVRQLAKINGMLRPFPPPDSSATPSQLPLYGCHLLLQLQPPYLFPK